jgi:hypothetical protein
VPVADLPTGVVVEAPPDQLVIVDPDDDPTGRGNPELVADDGAFFIERAAAGGAARIAEGGGPQHRAPRRVGDT